MPALDIRLLSSPAEAELCARLMATSEPWITFGRGYDESLKVVADPSRETYVAFEGDVFRGFIIVNTNGLLNGYIQTVIVAHDARGSGAGTQLVRFAEERIFRDSPNVFLCVTSFNDRARKLYERRGYEAVGTLRDFIVRGADEILMRKTRGPWRERVSGSG